jgi:hypothetical protein
MEFTLTPEEVLVLPLDGLDLAFLSDVVPNNAVSDVTWLQSAESGNSKVVVQALAMG